MPLPKKDFRGCVATVTMMEFRKQPGEVIDQVSHGMVVEVDKNGKHVASIVPAVLYYKNVIHSDGRIEGEIPLTFRMNLGNGGYGE